MSKTKKYTAIGLMSGSSLDGLDIACCEFEVVVNTPNNTNPQNAIKNWELIAAATVPFSEQWVARLHDLPRQTAYNFAKTHTYFGHYMSELVNVFLQTHQIEPDFIASHGHTVFHFPEKRGTTQIGDGAALAALTGYPVINDFRTQDVAIDGEGAPLAPIADQLLLQGYDFYLNLGGIANITCNANGKFVAFDIGPANQVLNIMAHQLGLPFDKDGEIAAAANPIPQLQNAVDALPYFQQAYPKSMDNNWIKEKVFPLYFESPENWEDKLHTACEQLAAQTATAIDQIIQKENFVKDQYQLLPSGGGALNQFLMQKIEKACNQKHQVIFAQPDNNIIEYKEAILMALMGVLRVENYANCLQSVTGAKYDSIGGSIHQGRKKMI